MPRTPKDIRLEVKVRNNLVLSRMEEKGIWTVAALCRALNSDWQYLACKNVNQTEMGRLINMKVPARNEDGSWLELVHRLADFFQCMPEDLFSAPQQYNALEKNRVHAEVAYTELQTLSARTHEPVTPELALQATQLRAAIAKALQSLTPREERVLRLRFGFEGKDYTLEEVGEQFGVFKERIRQIEAKALRKLQHPSRSRAILEAAGKVTRRYKNRQGQVEEYITIDNNAVKAL